MIENHIEGELDGGTYEIIQSRLQAHKTQLQQRLQQLNDARKLVFGSVETKLIANNRILTENSCISRDIVTIGKQSIFAYNVHFGLRTNIQLKDVFSVYTYNNNNFEKQSLSLIDSADFITDFDALYKYYRHTKFYRFIVLGNYLYMLFQLTDSHTDLKAFKWLIEDDKLLYVDNRSDHEYKFPQQHDFAWTTATRDLHRYGKHPHVAILDKVFVETLNGNLSIKIEDNTETGQGIYSEPVENADQTLDDAGYKYANLGNLIALEIKPFQEAPRYFVYNHKIKELQKIPSIQHAAILLPDNHGIIFSNGYYLQSGEYKLFEKSLEDVKFQERISSPNGEDFMYVFYQPGHGRYVLMQYNLISQSIQNPIICNGYTMLPNGELCYFITEDQQSKSHVIQIWQTPFTKTNNAALSYKENLLFKIGNKDIVRAMADSQHVITLLNKEDNYSGLYSDLVRLTQNIVDSYYWIAEPETFTLSEPLTEIKDTAHAAVDEYEKVVALKQQAQQTTNDLTDKAQALFGKIKSASFTTIIDFVQSLASLRTLRGQAIATKDIRYTNAQVIADIEKQTTEQTERVSKECVGFLLQDKALEPYQQAVQLKQVALDQVTKVIEGKKLEEEVNEIATNLEMLIEIVSNLHIEDTAHSTTIIDNISLIFSSLNQLKANLKNKVSSIGAQENAAEFAAQIKLIDHSIVSYLDVANTPDKVDELLIKVSVQLEELEARFAQHDVYLQAIVEKREEAYAAFEARRNQLTEARNKRAISIETAAKRMLNGIEKKAQTFKTIEEINGYFAADLMLSKLQDMVAQLHTMEDAGRAETIENTIKTAKEDALRKLKDKQDLYEDGDSIIKFGNHRFGVNRQPLDLALVFKDDSLQYHLTGTDFYEPVPSHVLQNASAFWQQEWVSENADVYRSAYLAYSIFAQINPSELYHLSEKELAAKIKETANLRYTEGYTKGVHDADAVIILQALLTKHNSLGLLRHAPHVRAAGRVYWHLLEQPQQQELHKRIQAAAQLLTVFPNSQAKQQVVLYMQAQLKVSFETKWLAVTHAAVPLIEVAIYLFEELCDNDAFSVSIQAEQLHQAMAQHLTDKQVYHHLKTTLSENNNYWDAVQSAVQWATGYVLQAKPTLNQAYEYALEVAVLLLNKQVARQNTVAEWASVTLTGFTGSHASIIDGKFNFNYHVFTQQLQQFTTVSVPAYLQFVTEKQQLLHGHKKTMRLQEFQPKVLTSFVRNKLIDQVYLPLIGDNLAKQLGTAGQNKRTDRSGMLLLVSPPGYGKTTLLEYIANRLGLVFMKISGPALGHNITSVDPTTANNSAARTELEKLNLALEMGNNVMLYLDDIQHCSPEFLQKFISLADGTRKMEGIYNGQSKTYDLKSKRFCVVMAGNPYTESGDKFKIPDMLANRSDTYNLGDIIGGKDSMFNLSMVENAVTSNAVLSQITSKNYADLYTLVTAAEAGNTNAIDVQGNYTKQELETARSVMQKVIAARKVVLQVNAAYINSAAIDDSNRTEPPFKLQGSYRDMNKLVSKIVPVMNDAELQGLLLQHYKNETQTLTQAAEANLLKYKEMVGILTDTEAQRWATIKETFVKNNKLSGLGGKQDIGLILAQMMEFNNQLEGIKNALGSKEE